MEEEDRMTARTEIPRDSLDTLRMYWRDIRHCEPLSREAEALLVGRARQGDVAAMQELVRANLRFVVRVARAYASADLPMTELIAAGNLGLMEAVPRFDEKRGLKFITYAVWWIRQAILRALDRAGKDVRPPLNQLQDLKKVERRLRQLEQELGRKPTPEEVAARAGWSPERVRHALEAGYSDIRLDAPSDTDDEGLLNVLPAPGMGVEEQFDKEELASLLRSAMEILDARERHIVDAYYGLEGQQAMSLEKIGAGMGLTRERVRQIRDRALSKMRGQYGNTLAAFCQN
jgi:RNA polymerase primary sigma factor